MIRLPNEVLGRVRTLPQALAELRAVFSRMRHNDPQRHRLTRMIRDLEAEIDWRRRLTPLVSDKPSPLRIATSI